MTINDRFKELRIALKLSQERFGEPLGLTKTSVSASENGLRVVSERTVLLCHAVYKASVRWMNTGEGEMFEDNGDDFVSELAAKYQLNAFQKNLVRAVYEMPPAYQEMILALAHRLVAENEAEEAESDEERTKRDFRAARAARDAEEDQGVDKRA